MEVVSTMREIGVEPNIGVSDDIYCFISADSPVRSHKSKTFSTRPTLSLKKFEGHILFFLFRWSASLPIIYTTNLLLKVPSKSSIKAQYCDVYIKVQTYLAFRIIQLKI